MDSFGLLATIVVITLLAEAASGRSPVGTFVSVGLTLLTLLFALHTSNVPRSRVFLAAIVFIPVALVTSALSRVADSKLADLVSQTTALLFTVTAIAAVARRLLQHQGIAGATVLGAVCVYLLLGLAFSFLYGALAAVHPIFSGDPPTAAIDFVYFSFVTLTTVGFGDLTPVGGLPRMVTIVEALTGQLFLVTVVALLVGNVGRRRDSARRP